MMPMPRRKDHRLAREAYVGAKTVALTSCILNGLPIFVGDRLTLRFADILMEEADRHACELAFACFMPEHLHALIRGRSEESDGLAAFERFKLRSAVVLDRSHRPAKWQKGCYDHVVRCGRDWQNQARYIALNPVRRGLVEDAFAYPYFFSSLGARDEVLSQVFWEG